MTPTQTSPPPVTATNPPTMTRASRAQRLLGQPEIGILLPLIALGAVFTALQPQFLATENLLDVLRNASFTFIIGAGTTLVFASGGLDLSVGSISGLGGVVGGLLMHDLGIPVVPSVAGAIAAGTVLGVLNGTVIVRFAVPALIVTLGMLYAARGLIFVLTEGAPVYPLPQGFTDFVQGELLGIPWPVLVAVAVGVAAHVVLARGVLGRAMLALGGNESAARLAGIAVDRTKVTVYAISGATAALSGVLLAGRLNSAQPGAGTGLELSVIAAVIIGGTSLFGGSATVIGSAIGAVMIAVLTNGLVLVDVSPYWQNLVIGLVIVLAVAIDQWKRRRPARSVAAEA